MNSPRQMLAIMEAAKRCPDIASTVAGEIERVPNADPSIKFFPTPEGLRVIVRDHSTKQVLAVQTGAPLAVQIFLRNAFAAAQAEE